MMDNIKINTVNSVAFNTKIKYTVLKPHAICVLSELVMSVYQQVILIRKDIKH
jgi:hypothetical protein